jgi:hypothetical protein
MHEFSGQEAGDYETDRLVYPSAISAGANSGWLYELGAHLTGLFRNR